MNPHEWIRPNLGRSLRSGEGHAIKPSAKREVLAILQKHVPMEIAKGKQEIGEGVFHEIRTSTLPILVREGLRLTDRQIAIYNLFSTRAAEKKFPTREELHGMHVNPDELRELETIVHKRIQPTLQGISNEHEESTRDLAEHEEDRRRMRVLRRSTDALLGSLRLSATNLEIPPSKKT